VLLSSTARAPALCSACSALLRFAARSLPHLAHLPPGHRRARGKLLLRESELGVTFPRHEGHLSLGIALLGAWLLGKHRGQQKASRGRR
jgi:hypothetical protein